MTAAEVMTFASGVAAFVREVPQAVDAIEEFIAAHKAGRDTTPAERRLVAVAEAHALGLDPNAV